MDESLEILPQKKDMNDKVEKLFAPNRPPMTTPNKHLPITMYM